jgi:hypothetical protein
MLRYCPGGVHPTSPLISITCGRLYGGTRFCPGSVPITHTFILMTIASITVIGDGRRINLMVIVSALAAARLDACSIGPSSAFDLVRHCIHQSIALIHWIHQSIALIQCIANSIVISTGSTITSDSFMPCAGTHVLMIDACTNILPSTRDRVQLAPDIDHVEVYAGS